METVFDGMGVGMGVRNILSSPTQEELAMSTSRDYVTTSCHLRLMFTQYLLKKDFHNEEERKAFKCVIQYHREVRTRFGHLPSITQGMLCLELRWQASIPSTEWISWTAFRSQHTVRSTSGGPREEIWRLRTHLLEWLRWQAPPSQGCMYSLPAGCVWYHFIFWGCLICVKF